MHLEKAKICYLILLCLIVFQSCNVLFQKKSTEKNEINFVQKIEGIDFKKFVDNSGNKFFETLNNNGLLKDSVTILFSATRVNCFNRITFLYPSKDAIIVVFKEGKSKISQGSNPVHEFSINDFKTENDIIDIIQINYSKHKMVQFLSKNCLNENLILEQK